MGPADAGLKWVTIRLLLRKNNTPYGRVQTSSALRADQAANSLGIRISAFYSLPREDETTPVRIASGGLSG